MPGAAGGREPAAAKPRRTVQKEYLEYYCILRKRRTRGAALIALTCHDS